MDVEKMVQALSNLAGNAGEIAGKAFKIYSLLNDHRIGMLHELGGVAFKNAEIKLAGVRTSSDPRMELHGVINHLENAWGTFTQAATKKSFFHSIGDDFFFVRLLRPPKHESFHGASAAAVLIAVCYSVLSDSGKVAMWGARSLTAFKQYAKVEIDLECSAPGVIGTLKAMRRTEDIEADRQKIRERWRVEHEQLIEFIEQLYVVSGGSINNMEPNA